MAKEIVLGLSKAKNLRHLVLDLRYSDDREVLRTLDQLERSPWPQLAHLRYSGAIDSPTLLKFLNMVVHWSKVNVIATIQRTFDCFSSFSELDVECALVDLSRQWIMMEDNPTFRHIMT